MFRKIATAAFAAVTVSALAQSTQQTTTTTTTNNQGTTVSQTTTTTTNAPMDDMSWRQKYDTYHIGSVDINSMNPWEMLTVVKHCLRQGNSADAYAITDFLAKIPSDQEYVLVKALCNNFKQASAVRDEVAMSTFGSPPADYAWLAYPPLTWASTPGQNSWSAITFPDDGTTVSSTTTNPNGSTTTVTTTDVYALDNSIPMTDDASRPMRMFMSHRHWAGEINYYKALDILGSGLDGTERGVLAELFHPTMNDPNSFTNEGVLDAIIRYMKSDAMMVTELNRFGWYNHFSPDYYTRSWRWEQ